MNQRVPPMATLPVSVNHDTSMGRILIEHGKITTTDTERILRLQREQGMRFGEAAQALGLITDADVRQALADQFGFSYLTAGQGDYPAELFAAYDPFGDEAEMLRAVRGQLMQRWFAREHKALVVAAIAPDDGASMFLANLGIAFAQLGAPTLIVDANMRHPRQHEIFCLRGRQGLSEILAGRAGLHAICRVEYFDDLSILPAGTIPPNPQELLLRPGFQELQINLGRHFSAILIDVPAFSAGADAMAVAAGAGGVLLVAHKDSTQLADMATVKERMQRAGVEVVGSVLLDF